MMIVNLVLVTIFFIGFLPYNLKKAQLKHKVLYGVFKFGGLSLSILSLVFAVLLNFPVKGVVNTDGGIGNLGKVFEDVEDRSLNFVYVTSYNVDNLFMRYYVEYIKRDFHPQFESYKEAVLSREEYVSITKSLVNESVDKAYIAAYDNAGVGLAYKKVLRVESVYQNEVIKTETGLKEGDIVESVNGKEINNRSELWLLGNLVRKGEILTVEVTREGEKKKVEFAPNYYGRDHLKLGFWVSEQFAYELSNEAPKIKRDFVDKGDSVGLLMAIQIYTQISGGSLDDGRKVVVTGAIDEDGHVNPVGSIEHKVNTAVKENADVFIIPKDNADEALLQQDSIGNSSMEIVPVGSLEEALKYLKRL